MSLLFHIKSQITFSNEFRLFFYEIESFIKAMTERDTLEFTRTFYRNSWNHKKEKTAILDTDFESVSLIILLLFKEAFYSKKKISKLIN